MYSCFFFFSGKCLTRFLCNEACLLECTVSKEQMYSRITSQSIKIKRKANDLKNSAVGVMIWKKGRNKALLRPNQTFEACCWIINVASTSVYGVNGALAFSLRLSFLRFSTRRTDCHQSRFMFSGFSCTCGTAQIERGSSTVWLSVVQGQKNNNNTIEYASFPHNVPCN